MIMMTGTNVNDESIGSNKNAIIIAVTIVVLAVIFMFFRDRQQKRHLESERIETQTELWQEWGPPERNRQLNNTGQDGERVL
ncbi:MAG: hypothetical protein HQ580_14400 [Planctomycetes bacterium]|nr:hypothetical protein [Planctomycetota bacterium]